MELCIIYIIKWFFLLFHNLFSQRERGVASVPISHCEGGVASVLISHCEGGVASVLISHCDGGVASVSISHCDWFVASVPSVLVKEVWPMCFQSK